MLIPPRHRREIIFVPTPIAGSPDEPKCSGWGCLSAAQKAGIVVGIVIFVLITTYFAIWYWGKSVRDKADEERRLDRIRLARHRTMMGYPPHSTNIPMLPMVTQPTVQVGFVASTMPSVPVMPAGPYAGQQGWPGQHQHFAGPSTMAADRNTTAVPPPVYCTVAQPPVAMPTATDGQESYPTPARTPSPLTSDDEDSSSESSSSSNTVVRRRQRKQRNWLKSLIGSNRTRARRSSSKEADSDAERGRTSARAPSNASRNREDRWTPRRPPTPKQCEIHPRIMTSQEWLGQRIPIGRVSTVASDAGPSRDASPTLSADDNHGPALRRCSHSERRRAERRASLGHAQ